MNIEDKAEFLTPVNGWVPVFRALGIPETVDFLHNSPEATRVLVLCRGGNTRSGAISFLLKYKYMMDALAASLEKNTRSTINFLITWADTVIVTEPDHFALVATEYEKSKYSPLLLIDLGKAARYRTNPFEIPFLLEVDRKLQEVLGCRPPISDKSEVPTTTANTSTGTL